MSVRFVTGRMPGLRPWESAWVKSDPLVVTLGPCRRGEPLITLRSILGAEAEYRPGHLRALAAAFVRIAEDAEAMGAGKFPRVDRGYMVDVQDVNYHRNVANEVRVDPRSLAFAQLLDFLYVAGPRQRYRLSHLLEAAHSLRLRPLLCDDEDLGVNLSAFRDLCAEYVDREFPNKLRLHAWRQATHMEYSVISSEVTAEDTESERRGDAGGNSTAKEARAA